MPGVGPAPLMPPAVFAVSWLKAVSFRLSLPGGLPGATGPQLLNALLNCVPGRSALVQAGLNKAAYGRPEENSMTLLSLQFERNARPLPEPVSLSSRGW